MNQSRLARLMVALCVMLSLVFMPVLSQQVMAAHHAPNSGIEQAEKSGHDIASTESCDKKTSDTSDEKSSDCCEMNCAPLILFTSEHGSKSQIIGSEVFAFVGNELSSRMTFGLKRPPRA